MIKHSVKAGLLLLKEPVWTRKTIDQAELKKLIVEGRTKRSLWSKRSRAKWLSIEQQRESVHTYKKVYLKGKKNGQTLWIMFVW